MFSCRDLDEKKYDSSLEKRLIQFGDCIKFENVSCFTPTGVCLVESIFYQLF
jgi:hypothetical protein